MVKKHIWFFLFVFSLSFVKAGTTGKISGKVVDAQTGEALFGVNVILVGTTQGAATDIDGNYTIINIVPGTYSIVASYIGFRKYREDNIMVHADQTTPIDIKLSSSVIQGEEVVVKAKREIIRKDRTSSQVTVDANELAQLPIQTVQQALSIQAGFVSSGGQFHVRGGRGDELATQIDGLPVSNRNIVVEKNNIQEMQVITGDFNAEYGNAMSGVVNIITKDGGPKYSGLFTGYIGNYLSTSDLYTVLKSQDDAATEKPLEKFHPEYDIEGTLSGPVPLVNIEGLTFYGDVRYVKQNGYQYGRTWFTPQGLPGDNKLVALNPENILTGMGKISWQIFPGFKFNYTIFGNKDDQPNGTDSRYDMYVPYGGLKSFEKGLTNMINISHMLSKSTFYDFKFLYDYSQQKRYLYENPFQTPNYLAQFTDNNGNVVTAPFDPADNTTLFNSLNNTDSLTLTWEIDPNNSTGYIDPNLLIGQVPAVSFNRIAQDYNHYYSKSEYWDGKFDLTSQVDHYNLVKAGVEFTLYNIYNKNYRITRGKDQFGAFMPMLPDVASPDFNEYTRKPDIFSFYIQDKLEYENIILNIGLRYDYFNANSVIPVDPKDPDIYAPYQKNWIYKNWIAPPDSIAINPAKLSDYEKGFEEYTPDERRSFMQKKVDPKVKFSPRIGVAYPITDNGVIHFSYGHFFQMPNFTWLYARPDFKISGGTTIDQLGNADLKPESTVSYEIGLQQKLSDDIGLDVTVYYRDIRNLIGVAPVQIRTYSGASYVIYQNQDYANSRGFTISLEKRYSNYFSARLQYGFGIAEGTYSDPRDAFNAIQNNLEPSKKLVPLNWDQRHQLSGQIIANFGSWLFSIIGTYNSGQPYTPTIAKFENTGGSTFTGWDYNIARLPGRTNVDLNISKTFTYDNSKIYHRLYLRITNLFDEREVLNVYDDTGLPDQSTYNKPEYYPYDPARIGNLEEYWKNPSWYVAPRQVQLGYTFGF